MKITIKNVIMVLPGSVECSKDVREGFLLEELAEENPASVFTSSWKRDSGIHLYGVFVYMKL
jgi:hypothetical protein